MTAGVGVRLSCVSKVYRQPSLPPVRAIDSVDLQIAADEFVMVVGPNGAGKSTFLHLVGGDVAPDSGTVRLDLGTGDDAERYAPWSDDRRARLLTKVVQDPQQNIVPELTVEENAVLMTRLPRRPSPVRRAARAADRRELTEALEVVGLGHTIARPAGQLSFGQQQLLALRLAFRRAPRLLILDEPTAALDRRNSEACIEFVERQWRADGGTVLMVTHDLPVALRYGNRLLVLREGRVAAELSGTAKERTDLSTLLAICWT